jgi:hypothetical protein
VIALALVIAGAALIGFIVMLGLLAFAQKLADRIADRRDAPVEGVARPHRTSRAWLLAVLSGGVTEETVKRHDVRKVQRRRLGRRPS